MNKALTKTMRDALRLTVETYDAAIAAESARWGAESAAHLAAMGVEIAVSDRTMGALIERGFVALETRETRHKSDCRGAYGRRTGGTKTHHSAARYYRPTDAGRAALAA